jgi:hypothetical protein
MLTAAALLLPDVSLSLINLEEDLLQIAQQSINGD